MDQYLLIPFLGGWTSIYQLFWCSPGVQGFDILPNPHGSFLRNRTYLKPAAVVSICGQLFKRLQSRRGAPPLAPERRVLINDNERYETMWFIDTCHMSHISHNLQTQHTYTISPILSLSLLIFLYTHFFSTPYLSLGAGTVLTRKLVIIQIFGSHPPTSEYLLEALV